MAKAAKGQEIIYSRQASDFVRGRVYSNPRFYTTPRTGVSKVFLVGDWPKIEADYRARGVEVERLDAPPVAEPLASAKPPVDLAPELAEDEKASYPIPADWRDLPYSRGGERDLTLRGLAAMFSAEPVLNKAQAIAAIEAELDRRKAHLGL